MYKRTIMMVYLQQMDSRKSSGRPTMNEDVDFPELLKIYRIQNGYRQAEAAQALGYSKDTIASWEYGRRYPANDEIPRLARLLEVDAQALVRSINAKRAEAYVLKTSSEPILKTPEIEATSVEHQGRFVAQYQCAANMSQLDLAKVLGVDLETVQMMEE